MTPYALDRSFHIHLPEEAADSVTQRPNYGSIVATCAMKLTITPYESPFTDFSPRNVEGVFDPAQVMQLLSILDSIRQAAAA
jgi:hypothetical protein